MTAALSVSGVRKTFGDFVALAGVSFAVGAGTTHALIGPNGAGKTTLVNTISGLMRPEAGSIRLGTRDITARPAHRIARFGLARTFQITSLFADLTVRENMEVALSACRRHRRPDAEAPGDADALLDRFDLTRVAGRTVAQLSHGDQRIVEVAVALAAKPAVVLLDEPTAGMSPDETDRFTDLLGRTLKGRQTVVLIEHDMDVVLRTADRITVLCAGTVLADGSPDEVTADPLVQEAYLGRPRH